MCVWKRYRSLAKETSKISKKTIKERIKEWKAMKGKGKTSFGSTQTSHEPKIWISDKSKWNKKKHQLHDHDDQSVMIKHRCEQKGGIIAKCNDYTSCSVVGSPLVINDKTWVKVSTPFHLTSFIHFVQVFIPSVTDTSLLHIMRLFIFRFPILR